MQTWCFSGIGILLSAAKDIDASQDVLIDIFVRIESFFKRLESYTEVPPTAAMTDIIVKIMIKILSILAIAKAFVTRTHTHYLFPLFSWTTFTLAAAILATSVRRVEKRKSRHGGHAGCRCGTVELVGGKLGGGRRLRR